MNHYLEEDLSGCMGILTTVMVILGFGVVGAYAFWLSAADLETDSYSRGNYAQHQCYPRAGDWPPHGDDCDNPSR
jgi:hypothetical protein